MATAAISTTASDDLMGSQCRVKESPRDADRGERLHHLEITGRGSASETQPFEVNKKRDTA